MIKVSRIVGESYDLETGTQIQKAIVLSNGSKEIAIHVPDEVITQILLMQSMSSEQPVVQQVTNEEVAIPEQPIMVQQEFVDRLDSTFDPQEADDLEPGEDYDDPDTGALSI
jgi:hypothetical protein